ncbi:E3 ubiquitin-protein ligase TRIM17-like [Electrophorus electricus]|uniref:E3 ubiquitin-protein ligase TRIM17-like n=1 Tax=Electrophorus electricus TaxID=8005 RepID=UPI0015D0C1F4|nr:E3 ubiquitin-protein ligase TRIM17-like [Electrophorus electricus]
MAEASISVDQDHFRCSICLQLLKDLVTSPCGHNFCTGCINSYWDQGEPKGVYTCRQCRENFNPRPALRRNNMLTELLVTMQKTDLHDSFFSFVELSFSKVQDVECDSCIGEKKRTHSAQRAVEDSEKTLTELIHFMENRKSEATMLIRDQEKAELDRATEVQEHLEREIAKLRQKGTRLEQLSDTNDYVHFLQCFQLLRSALENDDTFTISLNQRWQFFFRASVSQLKEEAEEFCKEKWEMIFKNVNIGQIISP